MAALTLMHPLSFAEQSALAFAPAPPPERRAGSLLARVEHVETLMATVEALDADDLTPELRAEFEADLCNAIQGARTKVDNCAHVLARYEEIEAAAAYEIARLTVRKRAAERQRCRLQDYILAVLEATGQKKLEGDTNTLASRRNPPSVLLEDGATFEARFLRPPPPPEPNKTAIKSAIQSGEDVPGARIVTNVRLVRS